MFKAACFWSKAAFLRYNTALSGAGNPKTFLISCCHVMQHAFFSVHILEKRQKTVPPSIQASIIPLCGTTKNRHYFALSSSKPAVFSPSTLETHVFPLQLDITHLFSGLARSKCEGVGLTPCTRATNSLVCVKQNGFLGTKSCQLWILATLTHLFFCYNILQHTFFSSPAPAKGVGVQLFKHASIRLSCAQNTAVFHNSLPSKTVFFPADSPTPCHPTTLPQ